MCLSSLNDETRKDLFLSVTFFLLWGSAVEKQNFGISVLDGINHFKCTHNGNNSSSSFNAQRRDREERNWEEENEKKKANNYNKNWSWKENNQVKLNMKMVIWR